MKGRPIDPDLAEEIDCGKIPKMDIKERANYMAEKYDWDKNDATKIVSFGPDSQGPNTVCDTTSAVQYLRETFPHVIAAFNWASKEGALAGEVMRGCRFDIQDVTLHADAIHRGAGQITGTMRRCLFACELTAEPRFLEPVFLVDIVCPQEAVGGIYGTLNQRRGVVNTEEQRPGTPLVEVKAYLPVAESFGFTTALRAATSGQAFPQCVFDHWAEFSGSPLEDGSKASALLMDIRKRKGLKLELPQLDNYNDKL